MTELEQHEQRIAEAKVSSPLQKPILRQGGQPLYSVAFSYGCYCIQ